MFVLARKLGTFKGVRNLIEPDAKTKSAYTNPNNDLGGLWQSISFTGAGLRPNQQYSIQGPDGSIHLPPEGRHWATLEPEYKRLRATGRFWFGREGKGVPRLIRYLSEVEGLVPWSWWPHEDVGHNDEAKKEIHALFSNTAAFDTPKPERLLQRILHIATDPNDLVLDSFLRSGTTAAVAHKMGRRWIGNVLTSDVLAAPRALGWPDGPNVVYGEACRLGAARLAGEGISFKQLPHAVPLHHVLPRPAMHTTVDELVALARLLSPDELALLMVRLQHEVALPPEPDVEAAWAAEIQRRIVVMNRGETQFHDWEVVRKDLGLA